MNKKFPEFIKAEITAQTIQNVEIPCEFDGEFYFQEEEIAPKLFFYPWISNKKAIMALRNESNFNQMLTVQHPTKNKVNNFELIQRNEINTHIQLDSSTQHITRFHKLIDSLRLSHLNVEEKEKLMKILNENLDVFHLKEEALSTSTGVEHKIRTKDDIPVHQKKL